MKKWNNLGGKQSEVDEVCQLLLEPNGLSESQKISQAKVKAKEYAPGASKAIERARDATGITHALIAALYKSR